MKLIRDETGTWTERKSRPHHGGKARKRPGHWERKHGHQKAHTTPGFLGRRA